MERYKKIMLVFQLVLIFLAILIFAVPFEFKVKGYYTQEPYQAEENYIKLEKFITPKIVYDNKTYEDCRVRQANVTKQSKWEINDQSVGITTCKITNNEDSLVKLEYFWKMEARVGGSSTSAIKTEIQPHDVLEVKQSYGNADTKSYGYCDISAIQVCPWVTEFLSTYQIVNIADYKNVTRLRNITRYRDVYMSGETVKRASLFKHYILDKGQYSSS